MTFINWAMLIGLSAVLVPILIHLLNRRHAKVVDWGAMRFLLASLTTRKRHIMIEEVILMALRCLLVGLLALAMARPFLPTRTTVPWSVVLPCGLAGLICLGIAGALWSSARLRWGLLWAAAVLLTVAVISTTVEYVRQNRQWTASGAEKDIAILLDGSTSMTLTYDGQSNFQRAVAEAKSVVDACKPGDAVSIILAGSVPRAVVPSPISDHAELHAALDQLKPLGGSLKVIEALDKATESLVGGHNIGKKIVLITDGQNSGWDIHNDARWTFIQAGFNAMPNPPQIVCRTLKMPEQFENAAAAELTVSRTVIGTDRSVRFDVKIANTGTTTITGASVKLAVDSLAVGRERLGDIPPNAAETVHFSHLFQQHGMHLVTAEVDTKDAIPFDNVINRVVNVIDRLKVLIVDGSPSARPLDSGAAFVELALTPASPEDLQAARERARAAGKPAGDETLQYLVDPRVVEASQVDQMSDLDSYAMVVLSNVPRLPKSFAGDLARYVRDGGGLLIAPGDRVQLSADDTGARTFYNDWKTPAGEMIAPAVLTRRRATGDKPARISLKTIHHPALNLVADANNSDLDTAMIGAYWQMAVDDKDAAVRLAGSFDSGDPFLVERHFGRGYVLMTAVALDRHDSNLPSLKCFLPLMHELTYYLAAPMMVDPNVRPGGEVTIDLPTRSTAASQPAPKPLDVSDLQVVTPSRLPRIASCQIVHGKLRVRFTATEEPGLYRCVLPKEVGRQFLAMPLEPNTVPFTVEAEAGESTLIPLAAADLDHLQKRVHLLRAESYNELMAAITGDIPGEELWKFLALAALAALLLESAFARWISSQRKSHTLQTVEFGDEAEDVQTFRTRARDLLAVPAPRATMREK